MIFDGITFTVIFLIVILLRWKAKGQTIRDVALMLAFIAAEIPIAVIASYSLTDLQTTSLVYDGIRSVGRVLELVGVVWYLYRLLKNGNTE